MSDETHRLAFSRPSGEVGKVAGEFKLLAEHAASFGVSSVNIPLALAWKVLAALSTPETVSLKGDRV